MAERTKANLYKAIFYKILTYGSESWGITKNIRIKIQEMKAFTKN